MACIHIDEIVKVLLKLYLNNENRPTKYILTDSELENVLPKLIENEYIIPCGKGKTYHNLNYTNNKIAYCLANVFEAFLKNTSELLSVKESLRNSKNGIL